MRRGSSIFLGVALSLTVLWTAPLPTECAADDGVEDPGELCDDGGSDNCEDTSDAVKPGFVARSNPGGATATAALPAISAVTPASGMSSGDPITLYYDASTTDLNDFPIPLRLDISIHENSDYYYGLETCTRQPTEMPGDHGVVLCEDFFGGDNDMKPSLGSNAGSGTGWSAELNQVLAYDVPYITGVLPREDWMHGGSFTIYGTGFPTNAEGKPNTNSVFDRLRFMEGGPGEAMTCNGGVRFLPPHRPERVECDDFSVNNDETGDKHVEVRLNWGTTDSLLYDSGSGDDDISGLSDLKFDVSGASQSTLNITAVSPQSGSTLGGFEITIYASTDELIAKKDAYWAPVVKVGDFECTGPYEWETPKSGARTWKTSFDSGDEANKATCVMGPGVGAALTTEAWVTTERDTNSVTFNNHFTFDAPTISAVEASPAQIPHAFVTIYGSGFGTPGVTDHPGIPGVADFPDLRSNRPVATIGGTACVLPTLISDTMMSCRIPDGTGTDIDVQVTVASQTPAAGANTFFSYQTRGIFNGTGGSSGEVFSFGAFDLGDGTTSTVTVDGTAATVESWTSTNITVTLPDDLLGGSTVPVVATRTSATAFTESGSLVVDPPTVTSVTTAADLPTGGGGSITVHGTDFGGAAYAGYTVMVELPYVSGADPWMPCASHDAGSKTGTVIVCDDAPGGIGTARRVRLEINGFNLTAADTVDYAPPTLTGSSPATDVTEPSSTLTVTGTGFGDPASGSVTRTIDVGTYPCSPVTLVTDTIVTCPTPAGVGSGRVITVSVDSVAATGGSPTFAYAVPDVTGIDPANLPADNSDGAVDITILGHNFGTPGLSESLAASFDAVACVSYNHVSDSIVECDAPGGFGTAVGLVVTQATQVNSPAVTNLFSYDTPEVSAIEPATGPTHGDSATYTVFGSNFGASDPGGTPAVTLSPNGQTISTCSYTSDTRITCTGGIGEGYGVGHGVSLNFNTFSDTEAAVFTYEGPTVTHVNPNGQPGGTTVTVYGLHFGGSASAVPGKGSAPDAGFPKVSVGGTECTSVTWLAGGTSIEVVVPAGFGGANDVLVTLDTGDQTGDNSTGPGDYTYSPPSISASEPDTASTAPSGLMTLYGSAFGDPSAFSVLKGFVGANVCAYSSHTDTYLECTIPSGVGAGLDVTVDLSGATDTLTAEFTYAAPTFDRITSAVDSDGAGGNRITVHGAEFGVAGTQDFELLFDGFSSSAFPCETQTDTSTLFCPAPPGAGLANTVQLQVGNLAAPTACTGTPCEIDYKAPVLSSVNPATGDTDGGYTVTVTGLHFGRADMDAQVFFGPVVDGYTCSGAADVISDSILECQVTEGYGKDVDLTVRAQTDNTGAAVALRSRDGSAGGVDLFDFTSPSISAYAPSPVPAAGGTITFYGENLGPTGRTVELTFTSNVISNTIKCQDTATPAVTGHTFVTCDVPGGVGLEQDVDITTVVDPSLTSVTVSETDVFDYTGPDVTAIWPTSYGARAEPSLAVTLFGTDFGPARAMSNTVSVDEIEFLYRDGDGSRNRDWQCGSAAVVNDTTATCTIPAGVGHDIDIRMYTGTNTGNDQSSRQNGLFAYDPPTVTAADPASGGTSGTDPDYITIYGTNFGFAAERDLTLVEVGTFDCDSSSGSATLGISGGKEYITCDIPGGTGTKKDITVTIGRGSQQQIATGSELFTFGAPEITAIAFNPSVYGDNPSLGSNDRLTIRGKNFGSVDSEIDITLGPITTKWGSLTRICDNPDHNGCGANCMECDLPPGVGVNFPVRVTVGPGGDKQTSGAYYGVSYDLPTITNIVGGLMPNPPTDPGTGSGAWITIRGTNFGPGDNPANSVLNEPLSSPVVTLGAGTNTTAECAVLQDNGSFSNNRRKSLTEIVCELPPFVGTNVPVQVCVANACNDYANEEEIDFAAPQINSLTPASGTLKPDGTVLERTMTIVGDNFGVVSALNFSYTVLVDGAPCEALDHLSDTTIECVVAKGTGTGYDVFVEIDGQTDTANGIFGYAAPTIANIDPKRSGTFPNGTLLTVTGDNFGDPALTPVIAVEIGDAFTAACAPVTHVSDGQIECGIPEWGGAELDVKVTVTSVDGTLADQFSYDPPVFTSTNVVSAFPDVEMTAPPAGSPGGGPASPTPTATLYGENFATPAFAASGAAFGASIGSWSYHTVTFHSHTRIVAEVPYGLGKDKSIGVTIGNQGTVPNKEFSYVRPYVVEVAPSNGPKKGGTRISIIGSNFGVFRPDNMNVSISTLPCENATWFSDSLIECTTGNMLLGSVTIDFGNLPFGESLIVFVEEQNSDPNPDLFTYLEFTSPYCADLVYEEFPPGRANRLTVGVEYFRNIAPLDDYNLPNRLSEADRPLRANLSMPLGTDGCDAPAADETDHCYPDGTDEGANQPGELVDDDRCCKNFFPTPCGLHFKPATYDNVLEKYDNKIINIVMNLRSRARVVGTLTSFFNPCENEPLPFFELFSRTDPDPWTDALTSQATSPTIPQISNFFHRRATGVSDTPCDVVPGNSGAMSVCVDWFKPLYTTMLRLEFESSRNGASGGWIMEFEVYGIFERSPYQLSGEAKSDTTLPSDFTTQFSFEVKTQNHEERVLDNTLMDVPNTGLLKDTETVYMYAYIQGPASENDDGPGAYVPLQQHDDWGTAPVLDNAQTLGVNDTVAPGDFGLVRFSSLNMTRPKVGNYTVTFTSPGLKPDVHLVTVIVGSPNTIAARRTDASIIESVVSQLLPEFIVEAYDPGLNKVTYSSLSYGSITMSCFDTFSPYVADYLTNCGHTYLDGSTTLTMVDGFVSFANSSGTPVTMMMPASDRFNGLVRYRFRFRSPTLGDAFEFIDVKPGEPVAIFIKDATTNALGDPTSAITVPSSRTTRVRRDWSDIPGQVNPGLSIETDLMDAGLHPTKSQKSFGSTLLGNRDYKATIAGAGSPGVPLLTGTTDVLAHDPSALEWGGLELIEPRVGTYYITFSSDGPPRAPVYVRPGIPDALLSVNLTVHVVLGKVVKGIVDIPTAPIRVSEITALHNVTVFGVDGGSNVAGPSDPGPYQCRAFFNSSLFFPEVPPSESGLPFPLLGNPVSPPEAGKAAETMQDSIAIYRNLAVSRPKSGTYVLNVICDNFDVVEFGVPFGRITLVFGDATSVAVASVIDENRQYPSASSFTIDDVDIAIVDAGGNRVQDDNGRLVDAVSINALAGVTQHTSVNGSMTFTGLSWGSVPSGIHYLNFTSPGLERAELAVEVGIGLPVRVRVRDPANPSATAYVSLEDLVLDAFEVVGVDAGGRDVDGTDTLNRTIAISVVSLTTGLPVPQIQVGGALTAQVAMDGGRAKLAGDTLVRLGSPPAGSYQVTFAAVDAMSVAAGVAPVTITLAVADGPVLRTAPVEGGDADPGFSNLLGTFTGDVASHRIVLPCDWNVHVVPFVTLRGLDAGQEVALDLPRDTAVTARLVEKANNTVVPWARGAAAGDPYTTRAVPAESSTSSSPVRVVFDELHLAAPRTGLYHIVFEMNGLKYLSEIPVEITIGTAAQLGSRGDVSIADLQPESTCSFEGGCSIKLYRNTTVYFGDFEVWALNAAREPLFGADSPAVRIVSYSLEYVSLPPEDNQIGSLDNLRLPPNYTLTAAPGAPSDVPAEIFDFPDTTLVDGRSAVSGFVLNRPYIGTYRLRLHTPSLRDDGFLTIVIREGEPRALRVQIAPPEAHEEKFGEEKPRLLSPQPVIQVTDILNNPLKKSKFRPTIQVRSYPAADPTVVTAETSTALVDDATGAAQFSTLEFMGDRGEDYFLEFYNDADPGLGTEALIPAAAPVSIIPCNVTVQFTVRDENDKTNCQCQPGYTHNTEKKKPLEPGACAPCPNAFFKDVPGWDKCTACNADGLNMDTLLEVKNNGTSDEVLTFGTGEAAANETRCRCAPGFFSTKDTLTAEDRKSWCAECPNGGVCGGGSNIHPAEGFWRARDNSTIFFECPNFDSCTGGKNASCIEGYSGPLCSICADGYGKVGTECTLCPEDDYAWPIFAASVIVVFGIVAFLIRSQKNTNWDYTTPTVIQKILLNYLQMLTLFGNFDIKWPPQVNRMFEVSEGSSSFSQDLFTVDCAVQSTYFSKLLMYLLIPILAIIVPLAIFLLWHFLRRGIGILIRRPYYGTVGDALNGSLLATMIIIFMTHPTVSRQVFNVFNCVDMDGEIRLVQDLSVLCTSTTYEFWKQIAFIALFAFCLGVPVYGFILLYFLRFKLTLASTRSRFGFLYIGLNQSTFYWEMLTILRKLSIVYCVVFIKTKSIHQVFAALWVIQLSMIAHLFMRPYEAELAQRLELASLFSGFVTLMLGLMFEPYVSFGEQLKVYFIVGLLFCNGLTFVTLLTFLIRGKILMRLTKAERIIDWKRIAGEVFEGEDKADASRELYWLFQDKSRNLQDPAAAAAYKEPMQAIITEMVVDGAIPLDHEEVENIPAEVIDTVYNNLPDVEKSALDAISRSLAPEVDIADPAFMGPSAAEDWEGGDWGDDWDEGEEWWEDGDE